MFARSSRYWFLKKFLTLFVSGLVPVEFSDFWLGDQFCSLTFSLASLWTLACSVHNDWAPDSYEKCGLAHHWQTPFVLSCMPSLIRFVQCLKRYSDSGLRMHMINGGKYLSSVMYYVFYYLWRHNGAKIGDTAFILLCLSGSVMSLYTSAWDLLVDWSLLDPMAEYRFLRTELLYRDYIPRYYFAIVSNESFAGPTGISVRPWCPICLNL
ncbi:EXS family-domain-containing protein [Cantharellus anzutake]|uniref:EXS family-domain-containing protein n=1 Tax=Cantharellus anzutake TaxID=1750568 RepID=UPI00190529CE|nr:EXS family-domain-containing protein [Cantharellus anzutake]KAF8320212.1 EXS family-domain-containing protein [Cantharellus anzutake]